jgi:hypothetical protein
LHDVNAQAVTFSRRAAVKAPPRLAFLTAGQYTADRGDRSSRRAMDYLKEELRTRNIP